MKHRPTKPPETKKLLDMRSLIDYGRMRANRDKWKGA
jgi:hypothetical protein